MRIAVGMSVDIEELKSKFLTPYPFNTNLYLIQNNNSCVFLEEKNGKAQCKIHDFKPSCCRNWQASVYRKECMKGIKGKTKDILILSNLFDNDEYDEFIEEITRNQDL